MGVGKPILHALNYCMLLPGPEAQQLATYIGWLMHRTRGGLMAGGLFILPGVIALMALSIVYAEWGQVGYVAAAFFGLKAAVLAIVVEALIRIGRRSLKSGPLQALAAAAFVAIFFFAVPFPAHHHCGRPDRVLWSARRPPGLHARDCSRQSERRARRRKPAWRGHPRPRTSVEIAHDPGRGVLARLVARPRRGRGHLLPGTGNVFTSIAIFFSKMALVTFGGAYAVLGYVAQQAVTTYHWVTPGEMLDGLGMAETTPGPLIMVLQFVGFMAAFRSPGLFPPLMAGALGGLLATWVTFTPCFLWIFAGAPYIEQLRGNKSLTGALSAITAAVVGVILNLAIWFAIHALFHDTRHIGGLGLSFDAPIPATLDVWGFILALGAAIAIFRFKAGMIPVLAANCVAGVALCAVGLVTVTQH